MTDEEKAALDAEQEKALQNYFRSKALGSAVDALNPYLAVGDVVGVGAAAKGLKSARAMRVAMRAADDDVLRAVTKLDDVPAKGGRTLVPEAPGKRTLYEEGKTVGDRTVGDRTVQRSDTIIDPKDAKTLHAERTISGVDEVPVPAAAKGGPSSMEDLESAFEPALHTMSMPTKSVPRIPSAAKEATEAMTAKAGKIPRSVSATQPEEPAALLGRKFTDSDLQSILPAVVYASLSEEDKAKIGESLQEVKDLAVGMPAAAVEKYIRFEHPVLSKAWDMMSEEHQNAALDALTTGATVAGTGLGVAGLVAGGLPAGLGALAAATPYAMYQSFKDDPTLRTLEQIAKTQGPEPKPVDLDVVKQGSTLYNALLNNPELRDEAARRGLIAGQLMQTLLWDFTGDDRPSYYPVKDEEKKPATSAPAQTVSKTEGWKGYGGYSYTKNADGSYTIDGAPAGHEKQVGVVVKPGMRGFDAIDAEFRGRKKVS